MLVTYISDLYQSCQSDFQTQKQFIAQCINKYAKEKHTKQIKKRLLSTERPVENTQSPILVEHT